MAKEPAAKPFYSVLVLAFVCSALVSGAAIGLRPMQEANRQIDQKKNILRAAGLYDSRSPVDTVFSVIETRIIELETGEYIPADQISPESYNQLKAALSTEFGQPLNRNDDPAGLRRLEKYSLVYLVKKESRVDQIILPVRGKGLWSTMYGYISIDSDLSTIRGISFYEHGETPGLGGEIENEKWLAGWQNKKIYGPSDSVLLRVVKGKAATTSQVGEYQVDGLSGATITAEGVNDLMQFWFGNHGFKPFFDRLQSKGGVDG